MTAIRDMTDNELPALIAHTIKETIPARVGCAEERSASYELIVIRRRY